MFKTFMRKKRRNKRLIKAMIGDPYEFQKNIDELLSVNETEGWDAYEKLIRDVFLEIRKIPSILIQQRYFDRILEIGNDSTNGLILSAMVCSASDFWMRTIQVRKDSDIQNEKYILKIGFNISSGYSITLNMPIFLPQFINGSYPVTFWILFLNGLFHGVFTPEKMILALQSKVTIKELSVLMNAENKNYEELFKRIFTHKFHTEQAVNDLFALFEENARQHGWEKTYHAQKRRTGIKLVAVSDKKQE